MLQNNNNFEHISVVAMDTVNTLSNSQTRLHHVIKSPSHMYLVKQIIKHSKHQMENGWKETFVLVIMIRIWLDFISDYRNLIEGLVISTRGSLKPLWGAPSEGKNVVLGGAYIRAGDTHRRQFLQWWGGRTFSEQVGLLQQLHSGTVNVRANLLDIIKICVLGKYNVKHSS